MRATLKKWTLAMAVLTLVACGVPDDFGDAAWDAGERDAARADTATAPTCADHTGGCSANLDLCDGDLVVWCNDNGQTQCVDCAGISGGPFHCALWDQSYGHDCLAGVGQACAPDFPTNTDSNVGCDPATTSNCTSNVCQ